MQNANDFQEVGIDLGTTNSVVSYIDEAGTVNFIKIKGECLIPSYIFYKDQKNVYYGHTAKRYAKGYANGTGISLFKKRLKADSEKYTINFDGPEKNEGNYYVVDTNVFIDQPDILNLFTEKDCVILPITVEQELEYRMQAIGTSYSAKKAIDEIIEFKKHNEHRIIYSESDESLLPEDFFKKFTESFNNANNDNKILSIALKHADKNPILISSDRQLAELKCEFVGVSSMNLKDYTLKAQTEKNTAQTIELSGLEATLMFLKYLREQAEKSLEKKVTKAVITVPANFSIVEVENTKKAALGAGFEEISIEKEPTAAAIAYSIDSKKKESTFVYDFGGGTFDVSVIKSDGNGTFEVCATAGNPKLGGETITNEIEEFIFEHLEEEYDFDMSDEEDSGLDSQQYQENKQCIYWEAERCKADLSSSEKTTISLNNLYIAPGEQKTISIELTRAEFEQRIKGCINNTIKEMNSALSKAELLKDNVDNIILAGGTSLMPCISSQVEMYFGKKPSADKNAATLIAEGAAYIANGLYGKRDSVKLKPQVYDMTSEDFGVALEHWNFGCIIPAGTPLPAVSEKKYLLVEDNQKDLNIKVYRRSQEHQDMLKTYNAGVEFLDEIMMKNLPPLKVEEVEIIVRFEITKEYELKLEVQIKRKDGTFCDKQDMSIQRLSMM